MRSYARRLNSGEKKLPHTTRASGNAKSTRRNRSGGPSSTTPDQSRRGRGAISGEHDADVGDGGPVREREHRIQVELGDLRPVRDEDRDRRDDPAERVQV